MFGDGKTEVVMTTLEVSVRTDEFGKGAARKLRATGKVPAVIYGPGAEPMSLAVDPNALLHIFKETGNRNTVLSLDIDGARIPAMVRDVQRHPVSRDLVHVDFYRVDGDRTVDVMIPVVTTGKPSGAVVGGRLRVIRRALRARCKPADIPETFVIDVSPMEINDMVKASQVKLPAGVSLVMDDDFNVVGLYGKRKATVAEVEQDAADAADAADASAASAASVASAASDSEKAES